MTTQSVTPIATPTLHLLCGKIASGKSTLAATLGSRPGTIILSEDRWLSVLYAGELHAVADYVRYAARLREAMAPHIIALLQSGLSVVLDFPANTRQNRDWMRGIVVASGAAHCLHVLQIDDALCKTRLHARNAQGAHDFSATDAQFELITRYFSEPAPEEGFNIMEHRAG